MLYDVDIVNLLSLLIGVNVVWQFLIVDVLTTIRIIMHIS